MGWKIFGSFGSSKKLGKGESAGHQSTILKKSGSSFVPDDLCTSNWNDFTVQHVLGRGHNCVVFLSVRNTHHDLVAVKVINVKELVELRDLEQVHSEIDVLLHLNSVHPNIVKFLEAFEDDDNVYIVMEPCFGGQSFEAIAARERLSEQDIATAMRSLLAAVKHCHEMGVVHRNIRPETILFGHEGSLTDLKLCGFSLSKRLKEHSELLHEQVGDPQRMAPEMFARRYGCEVDIWSCGILLYQLLSGELPFRGSADSIAQALVSSRPVEFTAASWDAISGPAKECVQMMLQKDPKQRASAKKLLEHVWMRENGCARDDPLPPVVVSRFKQLAAVKKLKHDVIKVLVSSNVSSKDLLSLERRCQQKDSSNRGTISVQELLNAMLQHGDSLPTFQLSQVFEEADVSSDCDISYHDFLAEALHEIASDS